ncbi:hypothetical protein IX51_02365 [uncultured archaeon]|nr:hypothetical protein IX51_02365 [uncultured archaeon]
MSDSGDNKKTTGDPQIGSIRANTKTSTKWIAVVIALLAIIGVLGGVLATHYSAAQTAGGINAILSSKIGAIDQNGTYTTSITASSTFKNMTVYFGDGSSQLLNYNGNNTVKISHRYTNPGEYYIFADINYGSTSSYYIEPVKVTPQYPNTKYAYRSMSVDPLSSSPQLVNNLSNIFSPGSHMTLNFVPPVGGGSDQIVQQTLSMSNGTGMVSSQNIPYFYNLNNKEYEIPVQTEAYGGLQSGLYVLEINTTTAPVNFTQMITAKVSSTSIMNFTANQQYISASATSLVHNLSALQFDRTNITYSANTTVNYTNPAALFLWDSANITLNNGSVTYGTKTVTSGTFKVNASTELSLSRQTNVTFNNMASAELNDTSTVSVFTGAASGITTDNATQIKFLANAHNVSVTSTLTGASTVPLNNGEYNRSATVTTSYFIDFPVVGQVQQQTGASTSFTNAEPNLPGGYTTLDPATAYYQADTEILSSVLMTLVTYNGSSTSNFEPLVAKQLPSFKNGEINSNYTNKTVTTPWGSKYQYNVTPGENYTFVVNQKIKFANGNPVTAWDIMYSLTRTLLFAGGSPGTSGWILGQYILPGHYFKTNTFYNITTNMTVDNNTNSITFHFQQPMNPSFAFQIFSSVGTWIEDSGWYIKHGAGITWSKQGFQDYKKYGDLSNYNSYVQNHVMPDGPYRVSYIVPGTQVTLAANPDFVSPGPWYPAAKINTVNILYPHTNQQAYLLLKSGQAQNAFLPTTYWNQTRALANSGTISVYGFPTLSINFYNFNLKINATILHSLDQSSNVPSYFFVNPNVRKAFAYAFNYSLYFGRQVGNEVYNTTFFSPYVGMLPSGMLYNQTAQGLADAGSGVVNANGHEPFQLQQARKYLNYFFNGTTSSSNHDTAGTMNVKFQGGKVLYNGNPLVIPIIVPANDPTSTAAVTTWGADLKQILPGASFPIVPLPLTQLFGAYSVQGQNPMPVSWGAWNPDYPFPTDYLLPMAMPINGSFYMGAADYTPYNVENTSHNAYNLSEASFMNQEISALNNATSNVTNQTLSEYWFHVTNGMVVNSTNEVYAGQTHRYLTISAGINGNDITAYQQNVMFGGKGILLYNLIGYNTTA